MERTLTSPFHGFARPTYTPVPDELFDELLTRLNGAELKTLLYIARRTFGFKRDSDNISLSQMLKGITTKDGRRLDGGTGVSNPRCCVHCARSALRTSSSQRVAPHTLGGSMELIHLLHVRCGCYSRTMVSADSPASWLLLIHQIPPKPAYLRVKIWRRLQALGSVPIKSSVYALPNTEGAREDFEWILREIIKEGGEATLCEARLVDGLTDEEVQRSFHAARDADYGEIAEAARKIEKGLPRKALPETHKAQLQTELTRIRRRLTEVARIDFFGAPGREAAEGRVSGLEARLHPDGATEKASAAVAAKKLASLRARVWVTRTGVHIDRIASAWLIRRFIDAKARFKFVPAKGYTPSAKEVRFDMFEAEFTHEGDRCTFEVLMARLGLDDRALVPIAEIVHDIDLKDAKFDRPEASGIDRLIAGIAMANKDDELRLAQGGAVFEGLYEYFRRKKP